MSKADLKTVKINGELFWNKWMSDFNLRFNKNNNRYECTIGNISDDDAAKLTGLGIKVKHKDSMGNFIVAKSKFLFEPINEKSQKVDTATLGNGSKCIALIAPYKHDMSDVHGNSPTVKKLMVTEIVTYTPPAEDDDEAL